MQQPHRTCLLFLYYPLVVDNHRHEYVVESLARALVALIFAYRIDLRASDVQRALTLLRAGKLQRHGAFLAVELPDAAWGEREAPHGLTYLPAGLHPPAEHALALETLAAAERSLAGGKLWMERQDVLFRCAQFSLDGTVWVFSAASAVSERTAARELGAPAFR